MRTHHLHPVFGTPIFDTAKAAAAELARLCDEERMSWPRYAGTTNNVFRRLYEWGLHPATPACWVECANEEIAFAAEALLQMDEDEGYEGDARPGKEGVDPSVFVYAYPMEARGCYRPSWLEAWAARR